MTSSSHFQLVPHGFPANCSLGDFRAWNAQQFNQYVNGKVYDETFWAPKDPIRATVENLGYFDLDCEWPEFDKGDNIAFYFPTYCMSLSAQYHPMAFANDDIGQTQPLDLDEGHQAPSLSKAIYPDQKTFMLEHYVLQGQPTPVIPQTGGVPWFFTMVPTSNPVTLFYDGHIRLMPMAEAVASDELHQQMGNPSLVAGSDPSCLGDAGYFEFFAFGGQTDEVNSYHVFTADGILGRDTIMPE